MIRHQYALIAEFNRLGQDGKFDIFGVFDRIIAQAVPSQHAAMVFLVLLVTDSEDDLGEKEIAFRIVTPSKKTLLDQRQRAKFTAGRGTWLASVRLAFQLNGMPLPEYGAYEFEIEINGRPTCSTRLDVVPPGTKVTFQ